MRTAAAIAAAALAALAAFIGQAHMGPDLKAALEAALAAIEGLLIPASVRTVHTAVP